MGGTKMYNDRFDSFSFLWSVEGFKKILRFIPGQGQKLDHMDRQIMDR